MKSKGQIKSFACETNLSHSILQIRVWLKNPKKFVCQIIKPYTFLLIVTSFEVNKCYLDVKISDISILNEKFIKLNLE